MGEAVICGSCNSEIVVPDSRFAPACIVDDFVIQSVLGRGGMGTVYLAHQLSLERPVALKVLMEEFAQDTEFIVDFVKEARAAARLNHPNIVQSYAVGQEDGVYYFAMEYVEGQTFKQLMRQGSVPVERTLSIIQQIADALDFAWRNQKLVHRDIKPDNIMLTRSGVAKLADLGLARVASDIIDDDSEEVMGTPQYICPEQLLGEPMDVRGDIYSLGATMYHAATSTFPFEGLSASEIARKHLQEKLDPPTNRNPELPHTVEWVIEKMMARNVEDRYQEASELVTDLTRLQRGENPVGYQRKTVRGASKLSGKHRTQGSTNSPAQQAARKAPAHDPQAAISTMAQPAVKSGGGPPKKRPASAGGGKKIKKTGGLAGIGITAFVLVQKYSPKSTQDAEQMYVTLLSAPETGTNPAEIADYRQIKDYMGDVEDYLDNEGQLEAVITRCVNFLRKHPDSLFSKPADQHVYTYMYGSPDLEFFETRLKDAAAPLAGTVKQTLRDYDEAYIQIQRKKKRVEEEKVIAEYRYQQRLKKMDKRVQEYAQERRAKLALLGGQYEKKNVEKAAYFEKEKMEVWSEVVDFGHLHQFDKAIRRVSNLVESTTQYGDKVQVEIAGIGQKDEITVAQKFLHELANELDLDVALVKEKLHEHVQAEGIQDVKLGLSTYSEAEKEIFSRRAIWLGQVNESLGYANTFFQLVSNTQEKLNGQTIKIRKYIDPKVLTQIEVSTIYRDAIRLRINHWSPKAESGWVTINQVRVTLLDLPMSEFIKLARVTWGTGEQATFDLNKGAFMFYLMRMDDAKDDLTASGKKEAQFMLDVMPQVSTLRREKQIVWALEKIKRYVAEEEEDAARNLYEKVVKVYGDADEFKKLKSEFENALN
jgi:serine/threonine protein kinase